MLTDSQRAEFELLVADDGSAQLSKDKTAGDDDSAQSAEENRAMRNPPGFLSGLRPGPRWCLGCYAPLGKPHDPDCRFQLEHTWSQLLPRCDFRPISRDFGKVETRVSILVDSNGRYEWIVAGQGNLDRYNSDTGQHMLRVYLGRGSTDPEHDSAYVLQLPVYGARFDGVVYHTTRIKAFIPPDLRQDDFRVPMAGYDPFSVAHACEECSDHHLIVPEGYYVPKGDRGQLDLLRGCRIIITFGPAREEK